MENLQFIADINFAKTNVLHKNEGVTVLHKLKLTEMEKLSEIKDWSKKVLKELSKHADRDGCYECKQLLGQLAAVYGIKPEDLVKNPPN